jgi:LuxR family maltose regulon positive regulatory protein
VARVLPDTKFYVPRPRETLVRRPRLSERLGRATRAKLTLISAPPGFGKTTLVADWLTSAESDDLLTVWVSLDPSDNESGAFWSSVATALQRAVPAAGETVSMVEDARPPPIETIVTTLANELGSVGSDVVLVLDDFHVIDVSELQDQVSWLLDSLPPSAHVVITTRADPAFPLARMRAQGQLVEVRADDLRFTRDEAAVYLQQAAGLDLESSQVAALEERTEGWIAALQLAALSMDGQDDVDDFIAGFTGDDRFVVDYLAEEVLQRQPADVRRFLLWTSILDRLSGALCDAVTGLDGGERTLEVLERRNLFLAPLDARREWYRYHQLFADVLRARLMREEPDRVLDLHRRASRWFEQHGESHDAIRHALAGEDFERAAGMIELAIPGLRQARQEATMRTWLDLLPDQLFAVRPVLSVGYVGTLMAHGELADVEELLRGAERWLEPPADTGHQDSAPPTPMVVVDEREFGRLPSAVALYRAAQAQLEGDREQTEAFALRAFDLAGDDDPLGRGAAAGFLGLAHWGSGDLEAAYGFWVEAMACLQRAGHAVDAVGCNRPLAEIRVAQGRLQEALRTYEHGLQMATDGTTILRGAGDMHVGMSEVLLEWNDLDAAADHVRQSEALGDNAGLAQNPYRARVAMAQLRLADGDADGALTLLADAERVFVSEYYPIVRPIAAQRARIQAAYGRLREAGAWVRERGLSVDDDLTYASEYEHITLARVLLARGARVHDPGSIERAVAILERLLVAAEAGGRWRSVIEILILVALARNGLGRRVAGLDPLGRALTLAEPEGYVRMFVAEGAPMADVVALAARRGLAPHYVRRLLDAFARGERPAAVDDPTFVEPLSERELDVLRLLASDLDGPGIADELVVGLSTVRTHTKSIYAKLGVNSRRAAVRRGEALGLLSRAGNR